MTPRWKDAAERAQAYRNTFTGPNGARVLEDLRLMAFGDRSTFDPDPRIHAYREGQRALVLTILNLIRPPDEAVQQEPS